MNIIVLCLVILLLIGISALCSGLNIALMSLSTSELRRKSKLGNPQAKRVLPFRINAHLSLAAILLTNTAAVAATSLVLESVLYGVIAGLLTTIVIVVFGEVLPQAYFSRRALRYASRFAIAMRIMIILTYPISKPLQLLLDKLFSEQQAQLQSRREIGMMITEHLSRDESELDNDEVEIIRGALQLSEKHVSQIMVPIKDVFWLAPDMKLTPKRIAHIKQMGRSRIPVFNRSLSRSYGVLLMKDMVNVDFTTTTLRVDDLNLHPIHTIGGRTALDTMLRKFIASSTHLVPVVRGSRIIGILTIEDLIEEIVGQEIEDESDSRRKRSKLEV